MLLIIFAFNSNIELKRDSLFNSFIFVYYYINYNDLTFFKSDTGFYSKYKISLSLHSKNKQISGKSVYKEIFLADYERTLSSEEKDSGIISISFSDIGNFKAYFEIVDLNSQRKWTNEKKITIKNYKDLFVGEIRIKGTGTKIINFEDTLRTSFDIFNPKNESILVKITIKNIAGVKFYEEERIIYGKKFFEEYLILPGTNFSEGEFFLSVNVKGKKTNKSSKSETFFLVQKPFFKSDRFVKRARQMIYIAPKSLIDKMIISSYEEREKMWIEFWKKLDPTPETEKNEVLDEYFKNIDYCNQEFSSPFSEGCFTDRGKTFMKLGPPDAVERHPFNINSKAYEIWFYYSKNYRLMFVDYYNLGDYKLENPPPELW